MYLRHNMLMQQQRETIDAQELLVMNEINVRMKKISSLIEAKQIALEKLAVLQVYQKMRDDLWINSGFSIIGSN